MRTRWLALTVVIALAIVLLVSIFGTGSSGTQPASAAHFGPIPVAPRAIGTVNTPIADGFTVVPGTALVGKVFLSGAGDGTNGPRGWSAVLLVAGDPRSILRSYAAQAVDAGFAPTPLDAACVERLDVYSCRAQWSAGPDSGRSLDIAIARDDGAAPTSHALLRFWRGEPATSKHGPTAVPDVADIGPRPPQVPQEWPSLGSVGELMFDPTARGLVPLRIEPGSAQVAPAGVTTYEWWFAVLRVTGEPMQVLGRFTSQLREPRVDYVGRIPEPSVQDFDGTTVFALTAEEYGATSYQFTIVDDGAERWMLVSAGEL